jgi:hypothetical protein
LSQQIHEHKMVNTITDQRPMITPAKDIPVKGKVITLQEKG